MTTAKSLPPLEHLDELSPEQLGLLIIKESRKAFYDLHLIESCIKAGADLHVRDSHGNGALHWAAQYGMSEIITLLISSGADPDTRGFRYHTPLYSAIEHNQFDIVRYLLKAGANPNAHNSYGWTPLHHAAKQWHHLIAQLLLKAGASLDARDIYGSTPLHIAVQEPCYQTIEIFLRDPIAPKDVKDNKGRTPWDLAPDCIKEQFHDLQP